MTEPGDLANAAAIGAALWTEGRWSPRYVELVTAAVDAALASKTESRAGVLDTLRHAAVSWKIDTELAHPYDDVWAAHELAPEILVADVRRPIVERLPELLARLSDPSPEVRRELARLIGVMPERRDVAVPALDAALVNEKDVLARLAMLFALARLGAPRPVGDVPSNPVHAAATRLVQMIAGGPLDDALELVDATRKLGGLGNVVRGFPGGDNTVLTTAAAIVAEIMRRGDRATLERLGGKGQFAECVATALWPFAAASLEPRTTLSAHERAWLEPITTEDWGTVKLTLIPTTLVRCGLVPGPHAARLLGKELLGPADTIVQGETPAWLLARRVCDGRVPMTAWCDAMKEQLPEAIVAIVADLRTYALHKPWPTTTWPRDTVPDLDASERFYALARAAYALVPQPRLEALLDEPRDALNATVLASLVDRGVAIPPSRDARLAELLEPFSLAVAESDWDVVGLRVVLGALSVERRAAALAHAAPGVLIDSRNDVARLTGLWRFVDMMSADLFPKLVGYLVELSAVTQLSKPRTEKDHAMNQALLGELDRAARSAAPGLVEVLRAANAAKPKKAAKAVLEHALGALGAATAVTDEKPPPKKKSARGGGC